MEFGNTTDSQVLAQGTATARSWAVNQVSDTKGNYFTVTYTQDTGERNGLSGTDQLRRQCWSLAAALQLRAVRQLAVERAI
jgi:hypothetical protein